jgi:hypothetical protein
MKNLIAFLFIFSIAFAPNAIGQRKKLENPFEKEGTLDSRFDYLYKTSTNYKEYKVISKRGFTTLQKNVADSMSLFKASLVEKNNLIALQNTKIDAFKTEAELQNEELKLAEKNKNSIQTFGKKVQKTTYHILVMTILLILLASTAYFFFQYNNSLTQTKASKKALNDVQFELDVFQKKALNQQQVLNRKLQDEILKNQKK